MKMSELDKKFDKGEEHIIEQFDLSRAERVNHQQRRIDLEMPIWMIQHLDKEASRLGIARLVIIKTWLADRYRSGIFQIS